MFDINFNRKKVITEKLTVNHGGAVINGAIYIDGVLYTASNKGVEAHDTNNLKLIDRISLIRKF